MLSGEYNYTIDIKGRLNIPSKLREELGERFVLTKSLTDSCLNIYGLDEWEKLVKKVENMPVAKIRNIKRHLFSSAVEMMPDKQGRILIPQMLREYCGLEKEVAVVGVGNICEIWCQEKWTALCHSIAAEDLTAAMEELGI